MSLAEHPAPDTNAASSSANLESLRRFPWKKSHRTAIERAIDRNRSDRLAELVACRPFDGQGKAGTRLRIQLLTGVNDLLRSQPDSDPSFAAAIESVLITLSGTSSNPSGDVPGEAADKVLDRLNDAETVSSGERLAGIVLLLCGADEKRSLFNADQLVGLFEQAAQTRQEVAGAGGLPESDHVPHLESLLVRGELPLLLSLATPQLSGSRQLFRDAVAGYASELDAVTDGDGTPHASLLAELPFWLDSFTRAAMICEVLGERFLKKKDAERFDEFLERVASLTTADGRLAIEVETDGIWARVLQNALELRHGKKLPPWARQTMLALNARVRGKAKSSSDDLSAATQSDWGQLVSMRSNWYAGADVLAAAYDQPNIQLGLTTLGMRALGGRWETELVLDGEVCRLSADWQSLCWYSEPEGDFLELRLQTEHATIDRQLYLSRNDHIALLTDSITTNVDAAVEVRWKLPLLGNWKPARLQPGRALRLFREKRELRVIPLAIPSDAVERADGSLSTDGSTITATLTGQQNLCLPLLLDWSPVRQKKPCDWNRLTVTQEREILNSRVAFAARCRVGSSQWLYLRNLEFGGFPRAVIGLHTDAETVIAEFPSTGVAERLVEVHYEDED
ncbi:hypothetical protein [Rubinisphaera margarita]|uniref:hypothetical protein n=1 Tax=Rubinisphaera margarita TaxID=2909586 RepID=UPI001EE8780A|nr:hypothetical protein [Rubinisphaera margarita]MCG6154939.1 hypothetical protein [Rubinisphaera margarita]